MSVYWMRMRMRMKWTQVFMFIRANSYIQNRWFTYYKLVGINLKTCVFYQECSMIANIYAIKQCYCDNKFVLWIEIVRSSSSRNSIRSFNQSIIWLLQPFFFLFLIQTKKKRNSNKISHCCSIVYRPLFCQISGMWKLDFSYCPNIFQ